ncbi:Anti-FecI sigma factor, FecR [uncultured Sphingopyxis sp.]|uniref:Anti-FecI sigma factor, FecR n=1 Tax=uncultured Sphingopyxis sp. TaxID=310581 RepID=A0A1Y5PQJ7_9SPHN|nr:FecR domain-containing protein [uncultured Sphingopyxis sp.]SBV32269.1 Anti-FecI sigma factor, FecR [uncultured Sphingopyxis sp.]
MSERETAHAINERAAAWVARMDREGHDPAVRAELKAWLAGDDRRRGAYFRAKVAWNMLDRASVLRAGQPQSYEVAAAGGAWFSRRRVLWGGGVAAAAAALVVGLPNLDFFAAPDQKIQTAIGEIRRVPLSDGSFAAVNTQTALDVTMKPEVRRIALKEGEAWFQVAKNRERPFIVEVGDVRVRAVGTAFSVRREADGVDVQVTEGVVEVWRVGDEKNVQRVSAGARAFVAPDKAVVSVPAISEEIDKALAWRTGQLVFDGDTVAEAVAEFNRYNVRTIELSDAALGRKKMIGRFRTNEPDAFARAVANLTDSRAEITADRIILSSN